MITAPKCGIRGCKHFNGMAKPRSGAEDGKFICDAFHNGIPEEIVHGDDLHLEPFEGDHGIRFEEIVNEEWEEKGHAWPWQKYDPSQPRDELGRFEEKENEQT